MKQKLLEMQRNKDSHPQKPQLYHFQLQTDQADKNQQGNKTLKQYYREKSVGAY